jgi:glycosyltransferase involved in cell wall biosynthesis
MKVLALIQASNEVCCRYRIEAFRAALADQGFDLEIAEFRKGILGRLGDLRKAKTADVVLVQRKLLSLWELSLLRSWSKSLIFDIDDAVYQRDSNSRKSATSWRRLTRFRAIAYDADAVFVGNDFLRLVVSKWTPPERVFLMPTCVNPAKYRLTHHSRKAPDARLIWIGQSSTLETLGIAGGQLGAIAERLPDMEFRQICNRSASFAALNVVFRPWSVDTEAAELAEGDIGIAFMPDDSWSLGKCGLKVLQYMAAGLPVVANPVGVHREMVIHGETGFLAATPGEWAEAVDRLASQPELRTQLGAAGRRVVEKRYSTGVWAPQFARAVASISRIRSSPLKKAG